MTDQQQAIFGILRAFNDICCRFNIQFPEHLKRLEKVGFLRLAVAMLVLILHKAACSPLLPFPFSGRHDALKAVRGRSADCRKGAHMTMIQEWGGLEIR